MFYNLDVAIEVLSEEMDGELAHVVYKLNFDNGQFGKAKSESSMGSLRRMNASQIVDKLPIKSEIFFELFPFHVVFNESMQIISIGDSLDKAISHVQGESCIDVFNLVRPLVSFTWANVRIIIQFLWSRITNLKPI